MGRLISELFQVTGVLLGRLARMLDDAVRVQARGRQRNRGDPPLPSSRGGHLEMLCWLDQLSSLRLGNGLHVSHRAWELILPAAGCLREGIGPEECCQSAGDDDFQWDAHVSWSPDPVGSLGCLVVFCGLFLI